MTAADVNTDPKLAKVRKALALAQDKGATEEERKQALETAERLILKYGIDEALAYAAEDTDEHRKVADVEIQMHAPFAQEKVSLYAAVAEPLGVRCVQYKRWASGKPWRESRSDRQVVMLHAFGRKGDLERAEMLYTSLLIQQAAEFARAEKDVPAWYSMQEKAAHRRAWLVGYASRIYHRFQQLLTETIREAREAGGGSGAELVLANRDAAVEDRRAEVYPDLRAGSRRSLSGSGFGGGMSAANRANLGQTGVSGKKGAIGS